ncbi:MAG: hypothetical protein GWN93_02890 [Deltaproteobacteria bacterium]|nr:hypothetical protein [Deltaproteobacteria bacterium]
MVEDDGVFDIPPPDVSGVGDFIPSNEGYAYKLKLIQVIHRLDEIDIDEDLKNEILCFIDPILTSASMTNIDPIQIREFLNEWKLKMTTIKIDYPDSITPEFFRVMRNIRFELKLALNMAKRGWRGDHAFEIHTKARYDVRQKQEQIDNIERWKDKFRPKRGEEKT